MFADTFYLLLDQTLLHRHSNGQWAMAEQLHNPEVLSKAQLELEQVIGKGNPVEESDIARLPYLQALKETQLRKGHC